MKQGYQVTVLAPVENQQDVDNANAFANAHSCSIKTAKLPHKLWRYAMGLLQNSSLSEANFYARSLQSTFDQELKTGSYDTVICSASSVAPYLFKSRILASLVPRPKLLMDFMDMDSNKWEQYAKANNGAMAWVYRREANKVAQLERKIGEQFDACYFVAEPETQLYQERIGTVPAKIVSIGNGIDPTEFYPPTELNAAPPPHLLFAGVMDYAPNIDAMLWFVEHVWPITLRTWPEAKLTIAGMNPSAAIQSLATQPGIEITGFVDEILPYFHSANLFIAPFRIARGVQNKVLQAFASGLPVITSPMGAEGILCQHEHNILICDTPEAMAEAIEKLINEADFYALIQKNALDTIANTYSWDSKLAPLLPLLGASSPQQEGV
jgi:sugar transferase (PEP-CTERM/EpsH1 system associated)